VEQKRRDPARRERILAAAAALLADNGFHSVSMAEIGERSGITGSAIYRHFEGKSAILVVLFERVIDDLLEAGRRIVENTHDLHASLADLIDGQVEFVIGDRSLAQVYHNEINNLPPEDQIRLRRKQRLYIEEWVHLLGELRPDLGEQAARTLTHVAIGAIQSVLFHQVAMPEQQVRLILRRGAMAILSLDGQAA